MMDLEDLDSLFADELDDPPPLPPPLPDLPDVSSTQLPSHSAPQNDSETSTGPGPLPPTQPPAHDASQGPPAKKRKPLLTLKVDRIFSEKGLPYLENEFPKIKFKGKGHEASDLKLLMRQYEHWGNRLYPKFTFKDLTARIEKLYTKKEFKNQLLEIRRRHAVIDVMRQADRGPSPQLEGQDEQSSQPGSSLQPDDENEPTVQTNGWFSDEEEPTHQPDQEAQRDLNGNSGPSWQLGDQIRPPWLDDDIVPTPLLDTEQTHSPTPQLGTTLPGLTPEVSDGAQDQSSLHSDSRQDNNNDMQFCSDTSEGVLGSELTPQDKNCSENPRPSVDHPDSGDRPNMENGTSRDEKDSVDGMTVNSEWGFSEDLEDEEVGVSSEETVQVQEQNPIKASSGMTM